MSYTGDSTSAWSIQVDRFDLAARVEAYYDTHIQFEALNLCHNVTTSPSFRAIPLEVHLMIKQQLSIANYNLRSQQWSRYRTCRLQGCTMIHHMELWEKKLILRTHRMVKASKRRLGVKVAESHEFWGFYGTMKRRALARREAFHAEFEERVRGFSQSAAAKHFAQTFTIRPHLCTYTVPSDMEDIRLCTLVMAYWLVSHDIDLDNQSIRPGELATWKAFLVLPNAARRGRNAFEWKENVFDLPLRSPLGMSEESKGLSGEGRRMFQRAMEVLRIEVGDRLEPARAELEELEGTEVDGEGMVPAVVTFAEEIERPKATSGTCGG